MSDVKKFVAVLEPAKSTTCVGKASKRSENAASKQTTSVIYPGEMRLGAKRQHDNGGVKDGQTVPEQFAKKSS